MILTVINGTCSFGERVIFENLNLTIEDNQRIGLIGANGIGKSTLLNVISKKLKLDSGSIDVTNLKRIGFLEQDSGLSKNNTIFFEMKLAFSHLLDVEAELRTLEIKMAQKDKDFAKVSELYAKRLSYFEVNDGYKIDTKIKSVLNGMGFTDYDANIANLSGGEKTRLALAKLLLESPDLLMLDEPTNHLDFKTLQWLESYLAEYKGAILVVSHDRYFLDKIVTTIIELENKHLISYNSNYSGYKVLRQERLERMQKEYLVQQNTIASMNEFIEKNIVRASTSNMAKGRVKALERMDVIEKPKFVNSTPKFSFTLDRQPVKDVLAVDTSLVVGDNILLASRVCFNICRNEKVALIGNNGIGKSTLLKSILGILKQSGEISWGANVKTAYYEQENKTLNPENTVLDELWNNFPHLAEHIVRSVLGNLLFTKEDVYKKVKVLSGGEKAKLSLAIIMMTKANVLIFDEPTNHLDLQTKEVLEQALNEYEGTLIFVSHDRYFLNSIPSKIIELTATEVNIYNGNFDFYVASAIPKVAIIPSIKSENSHRSKSQRALDVQKRVTERKLLADIDATEAEIIALKEEISTVSSDYEKLTELCERLHQNELLLDEYLQKLVEQDI